jgi:hypothetical protein
MPVDPVPLPPRPTGGNIVDAQAAQDALHEAAAGAPADLAARALSAGFHADQTLPGGRVAGRLLGNADPRVQAVILTHMIGGIGPGPLSSWLVGAGGTALAAVVSRLTKTGDAASSPQAGQPTPDEVDRISSLRAGHPGPVKTVGGAILAIALARMAESQPV